MDNYEGLVKEPLRTRGFSTKLTDSEVIAMKLVGECMGKEADKQIWQYFRSHWLALFPMMGSRSSFVKQSANLCWTKQRILRRLSEQIGAFARDIHIVDGFPMPVCKLSRARRSHCFQGEAGYSYCAAKGEKYYGFEGHLIIDDESILCGYRLLRRRLMSVTWCMR